MFHFFIAIFLASLTLSGDISVEQLAHAGAGALKEQLKGGDPLAGAIGAVVAETIAEGRAQSAGDRALEKTMQAACNADHKLSKAEFDALLKENLDTEMHRCVLTGQLAGVSAAFLAGRDVASAQSAAQNATENNFALTTAVAVGAGAVLVAANVYDYYQAYIEGGWNAVQAKWDEERALDTSLATAGVGAGMAIGPVGSAVGAAGGAIVGNATLRTKSILQRLMKNSAKKVEETLSKQIEKKSNFIPVEYHGSVKINGENRDVSRTVYTRKDIDFHLKDTSGRTNFERMSMGEAPIGSDGKRIELHHLLQEESGTMVELTQTQHRKFSKQLHGLVEKGNSFRNNPTLEKQYEKFRKQWWEWRATQWEKNANK